MWVMLIAGMATAITGDIQARIMTDQQPMKMAAAEALYNTSDHASFSLFSYGNLSGGKELFGLRVPGLLSFLATGRPSGTVEGIDNLQAQYATTYGPGNYKPYVPVTYWSFRMMIGFGVLAILVAAVGLWLTRRGRTPQSRLFWYGAFGAVSYPLAANSFGWIFTEMGRQPWSVFGVLKTSQSVSPSVSTFDVATSLITFTVLYGILAVIEVGLMIRYSRIVPELPSSDGEHDDADTTLAFAY
jgi:cytochrome d ubiquinol oxidase subunit I